MSGSYARLGRDRYASALRDRPRQHHSLSNKITTSPGARQRGVSEAPDRTRPEASRRRSGRLYEEVSARKLRSCGSADGGRHRQSRAMVAAGGRAPTGSTAGRAPPGRDTRPARYATTSSVTATGGQPVDWQRDTSRTAAAAYPTVARLLSAVGVAGCRVAWLRPGEDDDLRRSSGAPEAFRRCRHRDSGVTGGQVTADRHPPASPMASPSRINNAPAPARPIRAPHPQQCFVGRLYRRLSRWHEFGSERRFTRCAILSSPESPRQ